MTHDGGHFIPSSKLVRDTLRNFLASFASINSIDSPAAACSVNSILLKDGARLRAATSKDCKDIHAMIVELAVYEKEPADIVSVSPAKLKSDLDQCLWHGWVIEKEGLHDSPLIGFALCYYSYSTWEGKCVYLEDLYVRPEGRKRGYGMALIRACANHALQLNCTRLQWQALDWNHSAIKFYKEVVGARERIGDDGTKWMNFIMTTAAMKALVKSADAKSSSCART